MTNGRQDVLQHIRRKVLAVADEACIIFPVLLLFLLVRSLVCRRVVRAKTLAIGFVLRVSGRMRTRSPRDAAGRCRRGLQHNARVLAIMMVAVGLARPPSSRWSRSRLASRCHHDPPCRHPSKTCSFTCRLQCGRGQARGLQLLGRRRVHWRERIIRCERRDVHLLDERSTRSMPYQDCTLWGRVEKSDHQKNLAACFCYSVSAILSFDLWP